MKQQKSDTLEFFFFMLAWLAMVSLGYFSFIKLLGV